MFDRLKDFRPYAPFFTIILIVLTVLAFNLLADVIRDVSGESGRALLVRREQRRKKTGTQDMAAVAGTPADARVAPGSVRGEA